MTVHRALLAELGVERLHAAIGGSLGGMQALQWALDQPHEVERAVLICASARLTAQNIGFSKAARAAISRDGHDGMAFARMMAHITYLSEEGMELKFGRERRAGGPMTMASDFEVEHYLDHQAEIFLERFDPLTYLYLSRVMDYFDPFAEAAGAAGHALPGHLVQQRLALRHRARARDRARAGGARRRRAPPWRSPRRGATTRS